MNNFLFNKFAFLVILFIAVTSISGKFLYKTFIPFYYYHQNIKKMKIQLLCPLFFRPSDNEHKNKLTMQLKVHFYADTKREIKMFIALACVCVCVWWNVH